jgi:hypothetical protein
MKNVKTVSAESLSRDFSRHLRLILEALEFDADDTLTKINALNALESDPRICHSHDFCDANVAMLHALKENGLTFRPADEFQAELINNAWDLAKENKFRIEDLSKLTDVPPWLSPNFAELDGLAVHLHREEDGVLTVLISSDDLKPEDEFEPHHVPRLRIIINEEVNETRPERDGLVVVS